MLKLAKASRLLSVKLEAPAIVEAPGLLKRVNDVARFNRGKEAALEKTLKLELTMRLTDATLRSGSLHTILRVV